MNTFAHAVFSFAIVFYCVFAQENSQLNDEFLAAVEAGDETIVDYLIGEGANVNITDEDGLTALHLAASNGRENVANILITSGAHVNATDLTNNNSALFLAAWRGHTKTAELLIQKGANMNAKNKLGNTPLHAATLNDKETTVDLLIRSGAEINAKDEDNNTPLHFAAGRGNEKVAELLIRNGADVNAKGQYENRPLHYAAEQGHEKVAELLIRNGADVNVTGQDLHEYTPLHWATVKGHEKVAELLIRNGAYVEAKSLMEYTPLHWAAARDLEMAAELLIRNGADVNAKDWNKRTPLHFAVLRGHQQFAELLIRNGADINAKNEGNKTALHYAAEKGYLNLVEFLVHKNAIIMVKSNNGESPIDLAITKGFTKIADILREKRAAKRACALYESSVLKNRSTNEFKTRIYFGEDVLPGEFPWVAALGYLDTDSQYKIKYRCGGIVISDEFVLTAAHCVLGRGLPVVVRLGTLFLTDDNETETLNRQYKEIIKHPHYLPFEKKNDIALIRLTERIIFTEFIKPACLQTDLRDEHSNVSLVVAGWGFTEKKQSSEILLKIDLKTMALVECNTILMDYNLVRNFSSLRNGIDQSQYCAYDPKFKKDSCIGDSGGPLQLISDDSHLAKVIGVISFGVTCGSSIPSIYARVASYIDWIEPYVWPNENISIPTVNLTTT